jgi:hypothetical protein
LKRSDPGNKDWKEPHELGENSLFNVLKAVSNYHPEIGGYCQGLNIVVSWILKFCRHITGVKNSETGRYILKYRESDAFYILEHIFTSLNLLHMFDKDFTKVKELLETVENLIEANHPELCLHLQQESGIEIKDLY